MPVFRAGRDVNRHARLQTDGFFAIGLVPAATCGAEQNLIATAVGAVVDVPVVAAPWFESNVRHGHTPANQWGDETPATEILRVAVVRIPLGEDLFELAGTHVTTFRWALGQSSVDYSLITIGHLFSGYDVLRDRRETLLVPPSCTCEVADEWYSRSLFSRTALV